MEKTCSVEGCNRIGRKDSRNGKYYLRRGFCHNHYQRWLRNSDPTVDGRELRKKDRQERGWPDQKPCRNCGEVKPLSEYFRQHRPHLWYYKDCKVCMSKKRKAKAIEERIKNPKPPRTHKVYGPCAFEGCHNTGKVSVTQYDGPEGMFCGPHWNQQKNKGTMVPLRTSKRSYINDEYRMCTHCDTVKHQDEFHNRTGCQSGGKQTQCKTCQYKVVVTNHFIREGRLEEALRIAQSMAEGPRKRYVDKVLAAIKEAEFERSNERGQDG